MTIRIFGTRLIAVLTALFNVLALSLVMIAASLPVITAPVAATAAFATLDRWGRDGEDRVVRQFVIEFRARWSVRTTIGAGAPMVAAVLGLVEVRHFAPDPTLAGRVGLGLGVGALFVTLAALGYVLALVVDEPGLSLVDLWSAAARLAVRNLLVAGVVSAVPVAALVVFAAGDSTVLILGLPVFVLNTLRLVARRGLRRAAEGS